jgi:hypothetical protein
MPRYEGYLKSGSGRGLVDGGHTTGDRPTTINPLTIAPIKFDPPFIIYEPYRLEVDTYLYSNGREGSIHQELTR